MALVKFDKENFLAALEPGIVAFIVSSFKERLEKKLNGIVNDVYSELKEELPSEIKGKILKTFSPGDHSENIHIEVEFKGLHKMG